MKIQCDCGAKYAFDISPEMVQQPVKFVCPGCGLDSSERVNVLIRQQLGQPAGPVAGAPPGVAIAPAPSIAPRPTSAPALSFPPNVPMEAVPPPPPMRVAASTPHAGSEPEPLVPAVPPAAPRVRLSQSGHAAAAAVPDVTDTRFCSKHPQQRTTSKCRVCEKPMCPKCMELFGYVCSPHCQEKADLQGIEIPVYAGRKSVVERQQWGRIGLVVKLAALLVVAFVGVWFWYEWFGSRPHPVLAIRFENEPAMSGVSALCGPGQLVFIHGDKLARYDLKTKKEVWRRQLVDKQRIADEAARELKEMQAVAQRGESVFKVPQLEELIRDMTRAAERELDLQVRGQNIWVAADGKLMRYDWDSGEPRQVVAVAGHFLRGRADGDEIERRVPVGDGQLAITRFHLVSGQVRTNLLGEARQLALAQTTTKGVVGKTNRTLATKPSSAARNGSPDAAKKLDPQKLASQLADAPYAAKIAAPATIATALNQERTMAEIRSQEADPASRPSAKAGPDYADHFTVIPTRDGFVQFSRRLIEEKFISHTAMKAPPKKSTLDGNLSVTATVDVANELLNEMQRNAGGDQVVENVSRYAAKVRNGDGKNVADWSGEVVGPPMLYPLTSLNAIVAGKTLLVLDKANKQKWQSTLNYPVLGGDHEFFGGEDDDDDEARSGLGPVVERGDTLYVFDQGVLSAFEVTTGNARWRLPSVGISGIYFDAEGMIYVNTTTASPDNIKYSKQIDVSDRINSVVLKLDPKTGKELWKQTLSGNISYLAGRYIYSVAYTGPRDDGDEINPDLAVLGLETKPYLRIRRINPKNGRLMWEHFQQRGPLDVKIDRNTIQLVFKREVQVLKYLSF